MRDAHKSADLAAIDSAISELNAAWQAASAQMYQQTGANPGAGAAGAGQQQSSANNSQKKEDDTIQDADFEEVK